MADANTPFVPEENDTKEELNVVQKATLIAIIQDRFNQAATARLQHEYRMTEAYDNFRGLYGKRVHFRNSEKSRVFVKITKTKVLAGYGHLAEIVLGGDKFPIGIRSTEVPEGVEEYAHVGSPDASEAPVAVERDQFDVGFEGDGLEVPPGTTIGSSFWKGLFSKAEAGPEDLLKPGISPDPSIEQTSPAKRSAEKMEKLIHDQLEESNTVTELSNAIFESVLTGTGIIKGPFTYTKTLHKWVNDEATGKRVYKPVQTKVPRIEFVSVWDAYPDPNATSKEEMSYFIHRHRFNASQLRNLNRMPLFKKESIAKCLEDGPNYTPQSYESSINSTEENGTGHNFSDRFEVLEYWGMMGVKEAKEVGLSLPADIDELGEVQINAWLCGDQLIRIVTNPFTPARIPYHIFNYEKNPYSVFGVGIPENMSDSQMVMNGHARMAIDNLALAGGLVFDIDETALVPGQEMEIYNGKIFHRQAGQAGQAVFGIKFPNTAIENLAMFDKFRQLSDEETGIPSFSHGQTGVNSMTRTASGMSMLMGAASLNIKTVIKNIDNQLLKPLGEDCFQWNMQYFEGDIDIHGDLEVWAMGTNSLMQKEVRSQRLTMFLQTVMNPVLAPFVKIPYVVEELAKSMDLDPAEVLNTTEEARIAAQIIGLQNAQQSGESTGTPGQAADPLGGVPTDAPGGGDLGSTGTGNGNIGTGIVPQPGEDAFSQ